MSNIKELTMEHHKAAERSAFVKVLLSGHINPEMYATLLWNQYQKYTELEAEAERHGLLKGLQGIKRKNAIYADFLELWDNPGVPVTLNSTNEYIKHIRTIENKSMIFAHVYVHHMGDLSGGQIIAKRVPGSGRMYQFLHDVSALKDKIRARTTDEMSDEAGVAFQFAIKQFEELLELSIAPYITTVNSDNTISA